MRKTVFVCLMSILSMLEDKADTKQLGASSSECNDINLLFKRVAKILGLKVMLFFFQNKSISKFYFSFIVKARIYILVSGVHEEGGLILVSNVLTNFKSLLEIIAENIIDDTNAISKMSGNPIVYAQQ